MKRLSLLAFAWVAVLSFAGETEPTAIARLLDTTASVAPSAARGHCSESLPCPDGQHTAYCEANGPHTRCGLWGSNGVRCVAWNNSGQSTVASQVCP